MKASTIFCALLAIVVGAQLLSIHTQSSATVGQYNPESKEIYLEENEPVSGMFFSVEYVTEEYEYDNMYCLRYDDADANMFDAEIVVDFETYQSVIESINFGRKMVGSLVLNEELSFGEVKIFTFVSNKENS